MTLPDPTSPAAAIPAGAWPARAPRVLCVAAVATAIFVHLPALRTPLIFDDYTQLAMTEGRFPSKPGPFGLYDFINDSNRSSLIERGILPWWSQRTMELRFLRPLSSALLWIDHRVFGGSAFWGHLHSLLWWAAACAAVHVLLRGLFSRRVAWLGAFIFAVAPCHAFVLAWLANREEFVSTALGALGLAAYVRAREGGRAGDALWSLALFSLGCLAGEYTLCFGGYVLAMELTRRREPVMRRLLGIAPFALPAVAYFAVHHAMHYGAFGIGYYQDPFRDLASFVQRAPRRFAVLLSTAWLGLDAGWVVWPWYKLALLTAGTTAVLAVPVLRMLRGLEEPMRRRAIELLGGSLVSFVPVLAAEPSARVLEIPMVGIAATAALLMDHAWFPAVERPRRGAAELTNIVVVGLAVVHLFRGPLDTFLQQRSTRIWASGLATRTQSLRERARGKSMVTVLRASTLQAIFFAPLVLEDSATPLRTLSLPPAGGGLLRRRSARSFELLAGKKGLFPIGPDTLRTDDPIVAGEEVQLEGMRATVVELYPDGSAREVRFDFDRDLDDPSMLWLVEGGSGFREQEMPKIDHGIPLEP